MAKFNKKPTVKTVNNAGGEAYSVSPEEELYLTACSSFLEDKFYEKQDDAIVRIRDLVAKADPQFTARLIVYLRENMYLRSITHMLVVELAKAHKGIVKHIIPRICQRPDDMVEIISYQLNTYGKPIPKQIKAGIALAYNQFSQYQLSKYNRDGAVTLKDVAFLCHPERTELTNMIVNNSLPVADTWEVHLSASAGANKGIIWNQLITQNRLPFMAMLRNLRNIAEGATEEVISIITTKLRDKDAVAKSKQLPFRFFSAYKALEQSPPTMYHSQLMEALEDACTLSVKNIALPGRSLICADVSGSMEQAISKNSQMRAIDIGLVMAGIAKTLHPKSIVGIFGDTFKTKAVTSRPFELAKTYKEGEVGYSTNGYKVIEYLIEEKVVVDNILLFSDTQLYGGSFQGSLFEYKKTLNPNVKVFLFDLTGYGKVVSQAPGVYTISGFSDHVFDYIHCIEDRSHIVRAIKELGVKI